MDLDLDIELDEPEHEENLETLQGTKRWVQKSANAAFRTPALTALMFLLALLSICIIVWNLAYRLTIFDQLVAVEVSKSEIDTELHSMRNKLAQLDPTELAAEISKENARVFQGFPQAAAWIRVLAKRAEIFQLGFKYEVEPTRDSPVPDILEMPIVFQIRSIDTSFASFRNIMNFVGTLVADKWHLDILTTEATGNGSQLTDIRLRAVVWVRDPHGFVAAAGSELNTQVASSSQTTPIGTNGVYEEVIQ